MRKKFIQGQTFMVDLDTELTDDLSTADEVQIWYTNPDKESGIFTATVEGSRLTRKILPDENQVLGSWFFMSYVEFSPDDIYKGEVIEVKIYEGLPGGPIT